MALRSLLSSPRSSNDLDLPNSICEKVIFPKHTDFYSSLTASKWGDNGSFWQVGLA